VLNYLRKKELTLAGILLTHHHPDHSAGIPELLEQAPDIPVIGPATSPVLHINCPVKDMDEVNAAGFSFRALEIPGHTLDHVAYYADELLFCGDTLFSAGCGRIFEGNASMMYESLNRLYSLPEQTRIFCGHEYTLANLYFAQHVEPQNTQIGLRIQQVKHILQNMGCSLPAFLADEKNINPFFRCHTPEIRAAVEKQTGKKLMEPVAVFHELREWKNNFIIQIET
jgi:hydroxyacylglutathione hydrolase